MDTRALLTLPFAIAALASPASAYDDAERAGAQAVISRQIEAFSRGDAAGAHAFASPSIQQRFDGPDAFFAMVKSGFPPLIGPKKTIFGELADGPLGTTQTLTILDGQGQLWTAVYSMIKVDGEWRISGCYLVASPGEST